MTIDEVLKEIRIVKETLVLTDPTSVKYTELTIALIELQNSAIHLLRKVA